MKPPGSGGVERGSGQELSLRHGEKKTPASAMPGTGTRIVRGRDRRRMAETRQRLGAQHESPAPRQRRAPRSKILKGKITKSGRNAISGD